VNRSAAPASSKPGIASDLEAALGGKKKDGTTAEDEEERRKAELQKQMTSYNSSGRINQDVLGDLLPTNISEVIVCLKRFL
jgi:hypothetical protein